MSSASQKMMLRTTAEPMPCVASPKAAVLPGHVRLGQQPVARRRARHRAARQGVADCQRPHVDAEDAKAVRRAGREHGPRQLGVGDQRRHFEQRTDDQPQEVEMAQLVELPARAGQLGQEDVLAHEEGDQHHQRDLHVARQERQELPASARCVVGRRRSSSVCAAGSAPSGGSVSASADDGGSVLTMSAAATAGSADSSVRRLRRRARRLCRFPLMRGDWSPAVERTGSPVADSSPDALGDALACSLSGCSPASPSSGDSIALMLARRDT